jgi:hypothetical protein
MTASPPSSSPPHRHAVYLAARDRHPSRWARHTRDWTPITTVRLNPERGVTSEPADHQLRGNDLDTHRPCFGTGSGVRGGVVFGVRRGTGPSIPVPGLHARIRTWNIDSAPLVIRLPVNWLSLTLEKNRPPSPTSPRTLTFGIQAGLPRIGDDSSPSFRAVNSSIRQRSSPRRSTRTADIEVHGPCRRSDAGLGAGSTT